MEDIGLNNNDLPSTQNTDNFINIICSKMPKNSILLEEAGSNSNLYKSFPFNAYGNLKVTKTTTKVIFEFYITGGGITSGLNGMQSQTRKNHTIENDLWLMTAYFSGGQWKTQGYKLITQNTNVVRTKTLTDDATQVSFYFGLYDEFEVQMENVYTSILSSGKVTYMGQKVALSNSNLTANKQQPITAYREAQINEHSLKLNEYRSTNGTISSGKVFSINCHKTGFYKDNERVGASKIAAPKVIYDGTKKVTD